MPVGGSFFFRDTDNRCPEICLIHWESQAKHPNILGMAGQVGHLQQQGDSKTWMFLLMACHQF